VDTKQHKFLGVSRRDMLTLIGTVAGGTALYQAMGALGHAAESGYRGPVKLQGTKRGTSVVVLGAGLAGMVAAYELREAGYKVQVLEFNHRAGGRCWSLRGGDVVDELGQGRQRCEFAEDEYFNPGPWRIPYHHYALLDYCKRLGVVLEPFIQTNYNAFVHAKDAFAGKPQRFRTVQADFHGYVAELLGKAAMQGNLDAELTQEDKEKLLESLRSWGALDSKMRYAKSSASSDRRGYNTPPGGGLMPASELSTPLKMDDLLRSGLWQHLSTACSYNYQSSLFQPVGGIDMIAKAFARELARVIRYGAKVSKIDQDANGVSITYEDQLKDGKLVQAKADWCVCTIPLSMLRKIDIQVSAEMKEAIAAVPYSGSYKAGLQFKRRFWEQDEMIYGGITYTDLPISGISYPSTKYGSSGRGVVLGAYAFGKYADRFADMDPDERIREAVHYGSQIHPQYLKEFDCGVSVGWKNVPWIEGCYGSWTDALRAKHYKRICEIDGRIVLAGEHASYIPAWMEGAVLSSLDAIERLHAKASA
jgi:monoamine oxidase